MIRLSDILTEVIEGAKVDFDDKGEVSSIDISYKHLDGEQLNTDNGVNKRRGYEVYYSLSSDPKASNVKAAQDALKYNSDKIESSELKSLLASTIKTRLPKIDYIGFLESEGSLNKLLLDTFQELYPSAQVVPIEKIQYENIDDAVDWGKFNKQTSNVKNTVIDFLYKTAEKKPPYKIRKSDKLQSLLVRLLHSKYDIGLHPSGKGKESSSAYSAVMDCLRSGKVMVIIDDNTHTGTDFKNIFRSIDDIAKRMEEINSKPSENEREALDTLDKIKAHKSFKTSKHLQDQFTRLEQIFKIYRERIDILNRAPSKRRNYFFGYALYLLKDSDLGIKKKSDLEKSMVDTDD
jgi:hypothetical protein